MGIIQKIAEGLRKTKDFFLGRLQKILNSFTVIDDELFDQLEEAMIMSDIGVETSEEICDRLRKKIKERGITDPKMIMELIQEIIGEIMGDDTGLDLSVSPSVIMVIGVNGAGKTTTIGKMCHQFKKEKKKVLVAAADTFRAAAIDQLEVWTERAGVEIVKHAEGSDPGAVVYDALDAAKARGCDVVIIDTAGRLHNKKNLMEELAKINRIIDKKAPESSRETLLVLDATTGQNAVNQAKLFGETANITGIVLTKLDGTAKGGIVISIKNELGIPVKLIGVGEKIDDLQPFDSRSFVTALFSDVEPESEKTEEISEVSEEIEEVEEVEEAVTEEPKKQGLFGKLFGSKETEVEEEISETVEETEEIPETAVEETVEEETEEQSEELKNLEEEKENRKQRFFSKFAIAEEEPVQAVEKDEEVTEESETFDEEETEEDVAVETFDEPEIIEEDKSDESDIIEEESEENDSDEESEEDTVEEPEEEETAEEVEQPKAKKRGFFSRLFGRKDKDDD
ncbi:MAG: signal recognition particle-docking protein FtsY [Ruminococcus sp.]|nr:signal recognition particle-docking protein FtsY [Ruminococcus sp.]